LQVFFAKLVLALGVAPRRARKDPHREIELTKSLRAARTDPVEELKEG
jgi:hypothetical protein